MNYRYTTAQRLVKKIYRRFDPVPRSPWTAGHVDDICAVNLVPPEKLIAFFQDCLVKLRALKGAEVGDYLEFGIFNGNSIGSMYLAKEAEQADKMRLIGFDAFEGLPAGSENEDDGVWKKGFYSCSFEQMQGCLRRRNVNPDRITWVNGWYDKTLNEATRQRLQLNNIGIVFVDCDTYSSSKTVLHFLQPLLKQPAIICFDDWKLNDLDIKGMGEYRSFKEFLESNPGIMATEIESYNRKSKTFFIRPAEAGDGYDGSPKPAQS